jgi:hypothetical protein
VLEVEFLKRVEMLDLETVGSLEEIMCLYV